MNRPGSLTAAAILMIIGGITSVLSPIAWISYGIASYGLACLCAFIPLYAIAVGIFEFITASKLLSNGRPIVSESSLKTLAICEIITILNGNVISVAAGIIVLVAIADPEVRRYLGWPTTATAPFQSGAAYPAATQLSAPSDQEPPEWRQG